MKTNKKLIEQLSNGEIALRNDGTKEQLEQVLKAAFPEDACNYHLDDFEDDYAFMAEDDTYWMYVSDESEEELRKYTLVSINKFFFTESKEERLAKLEAELKELCDEIKKEKEPKVGDLVVGWHNITNKHELHKKVWKIKAINTEYAIPEIEPAWSTTLNGIRKATPEEVKAFNEPKVGELVVVTKRHFDNSAKEGMICTLKSIDDNIISDADYEVEDTNKLYNWAILRTWCEDVRKATPEEIEKYNESKYKIGDTVVVKSWRQCNEGNGIGTDNLISKLYNEEDKVVSGMLPEESDFVVKQGYNFYRIRASHIIRKATEEEIKELDKPKLPKIGCKEGRIGTNHIIYGTKELSKSALRQMERLGVVDLTIETEGEIIPVTTEQLESIYKVANLK